jgi:S-adenosylmethionine hydrolase
VDLPIFLFTDFGAADLYVGQVKAVLHERAPRSTVIDLLNDAPDFEIAASAHLLAALVSWLPRPCVVMAVVDPGVGGARGAVALEADGQWLVGPDNGLLSVLAARAKTTACFGLDWLPPAESASFHGRDIFAPAAAEIASDCAAMRMRPAKRALDVSLDAADLACVVYVDHYGNAMTGLRAESLPSSTILRVNGRAVRYARVFSEAPSGCVFWYRNSIGLIELAANKASASAVLSLRVGDEVVVEHGLAP